MLQEETWTEKKLPNGTVQFVNKAGGDLMMLPVRALRCLHAACPAFSHADAPPQAELDYARDPAVRKIVAEYAKDEELFFKDFAAAFKKLIENGVKCVPPPRALLLLGSRSCCSRGRFPEEKKGFFARIFG